MQCPVCQYGLVEMMWGCSITNADAPNETVERMWCCHECRSSGVVGYTQDLSTTHIIVRGDI
jgi:hypothetical protein